MSSYFATVAAVYLLLFLGVILPLIDSFYYINAPTHISNGWRSNSPSKTVLKTFHSNSGGSGSGSGSGGTNGPIDPRLFDENERNDTSSDKDRNVFLQKWESLSIDAKKDLESTALMIIFAVTCRWFVIEPRYIPSLSMFPTFEVGDYVLVNKLSFLGGKYRKKDVVVFTPPDAYVALTGSTDALIKRIIAVEGDMVEVKNHHLYINGIVQDEEYINELSEYDLPKTTIPTGMLLVLGDNRNYSFDSHDWGFVPEQNVLGRAFLKYWPPQRIGLVQ